MPRPEGLAGPFVSGAFLCEKVLTETDQVPTFVRVAERFFVPVMPTRLPPGIQLPQLPAPILQCILVVMLKAGDVPGGPYMVRIDHIPPEGPEARGPDVAIMFNGSDENGAMIKSQINIPAPQQGLHWFDVYFENDRLSRIPMRVINQPIQIQFMPQPAPPPVR
jgi:hypothetical protein